MKSSKLLIQSKIFNRLAHVNVFEIGNAARESKLYVFLGGSGIDETAYFERSKSLIPLFNESLTKLERRYVNAVVVYVTSPYDVSFDRISSDNRLALQWERHVLEELCCEWRNQEFYLMAFSGGTALALSGLHRNPMCKGVGLLGPEQFPSNWQVPPSWKHPLQVYCARDDLVCSSPTSLRRFELLERQRQLEVIECDSGGHSLKNYIDGLFIQAFRFADDCF